MITTEERLLRNKKADELRNFQKKYCEGLDLLIIDQFCPQCKQKNLVKTGDCSTYVGYVITFDDNGNPHLHDKNQMQKQFTCSCGCKIIVTYNPKCPSCDFGGLEHVNCITE